MILGVEYFNSKDEDVELLDVERAERSRAEQRRTGLQCRRWWCGGDGGRGNDLLERHEQVMAGALVLVLGWGSCAQRTKSQSIAARLGGYSRPIISLCSLLPSPNYHLHFRNIQLVKIVKTNLKVELSE